MRQVLRNQAEYQHQSGKQKKESEKENHTVKTLESGMNDILNKKLVNPSIRVTFFKQMICKIALNKIEETILRRKK